MPVRRKLKEHSGIEAPPALKRKGGQKKDVQLDQEVRNAM